MGGTGFKGGGGTTFSAWCPPAHTMNHEQGGALILKQMLKKQTGFDLLLKKQTRFLMHPRK